MANKEPKVKKYRVRRFFKELKRVRWPSNRENWISFIKVVAFTVIFTVVVVLFATFVTFIWGQAGVK
ncbi:preprotein translocase subunit SecE [Mycoplasma simbae]|uniref:preprotein translocase subunit SecE n=1 Tax=Mycoplasma simbae TaxID=36744 RepID=UPI00049629E1|nr:preprotein translocase subunit SecE [Mycoplasma simbae]